MKNLDPPKFLGQGSGSAFRCYMITTINFGPHTHLELSWPSFELITIFENFVKIVKKIGLHLGGDLLEIYSIFKHFTPRIDISDL